MFFCNVLVAAVMGAVMVSARVIGDVRPLTTSPSSSSSSTPVLSKEQCAFHPHNHLTHSISLSQRPISPDAYNNIPSHAWPYITSLMLTHSNPLTSSLPITKNNVQTLRLSGLTNDVTLESVVLGLVFTVPDSNAVGNLELRNAGGEVKNGEKERNRKEERMCVEQAIGNVEAGKQVEGVLDIEGRGKMGFLVYRVD